MPDLHGITSERRFAAPLVLGVISDTHIYPGGRRSVPEPCLALFRRFKVRLIAHAGDANTLETLDLLATIAPVLAVAGNNDDTQYREVIPDVVTFTVGRHTIGLVHGNGPGTARSQVRDRFAGEVDLAIYGHSHKPMIEKEEGTIFFNPGSPTDRRWSEHFGIGIIRFEEERFYPEIILFKDARELDGVKPDWG